MLFPKLRQRLVTSSQCVSGLVEWEAGTSDTQRSLRKESLNYLLVAKIFMPRAESDKSLFK